MKMAVFFISFIFSLILSSTYATVQDFCVADYAGPEGPAGYSCRRPENVTVNDFVYSGLDIPGNTSLNPFGVAQTPVSDAQLPALNGQRISISRVDIARGGVVPLHTHPRASELFFLMQGSVTCGFISADRNTVYVRNLRSGDAILFPQGLLHFIVNNGGPAVGYAIYNRQRIPLQVVSLALFGNNLFTDFIFRSTFLDITQIKKLKAVFGGTN